MLPVAVRMVHVGSRSTPVLESQASGMVHPSSPMVPATLSSAVGCALASSQSTDTSIGLHISRRMATLFWGFSS